MKRKRHGKERCLAILASVALLTLLLTSCTQLVLPTARKSKVEIDEFLVKTENKGGADQTIVPIDSILGMPERLSGNVLLTRENTVSGAVYRFYSISDGKLLATADEGTEVGFVSSYLIDAQKAQGIFYTVNNDIMHIYNIDGTEAISAFYNSEDGTPLISDAATLNGFSFNGVEYFVRDGFVVLEGYRPLESEYFNASVEYGERFYYISDEMAFVFDDKGALLHEYRVPSYAQGAHIFVLGNGNIFIQYIYSVIEGEEYDFVRNNQRYKIVSLLINVENGTESAPILPFMVTDLHNGFNDEGFYEKYTQRVDNLAYIIEIDNKRIDENAPVRYVVLSDNLIELFSLFDLVNGALDITRISYDRNLVTTAAGSMLVAGDGTVIGQLNNFHAITEQYIVTSGAIYDHDLKAIFNLTEQGYTFLDSVGDNVILSKVVDEVAGLYLFSGTEPVYIGEAASYEACFEGYAVKGRDGVGYYNEKGELLVQTEEEIRWIYQASEEGIETHVGYTFDAKGNVKYYRLQFTDVSFKGIG